MDYNLERFKREQAYDYETALREIRGGRKTSHWIWYIFPQMKGLGTSGMSDYYGISDIEEAKAYLADPVLGPRQAVRSPCFGACWTRITAGRKMSERCGF